MRAGLIFLGFGYVLSQFYRSFLAVLTPNLQTDLGATPEQLSAALGLWFLSFSAMQIPIGWALDRIGPRVTSSVLLLLGGAGGALVFALAATPVHIMVAMFLIGIGCAPVLMASYFIFARAFPAHMFATLGALMIGLGSFGNLAGAVPLNMLVEVVGWRSALLGLSGVSVIVAVGLWFMVENPPRVAAPETGALQDFLQLKDLLNVRLLWPMFPLMLVSYAPAAGFRGLWIAPYLSEVYQADSATIGFASSLMACAMIAGALLYGPADRIFKTRKWVIIVGNSICAFSCFSLFLVPAAGLLPSMVLFGFVGFFGMSFPMLMAHGRSFAPVRLTGRAVTLFNLLSIGGVGILQFVTGRLHAVISQLGLQSIETYQLIFLFYTGLLTIGVAFYLLSQDRLD
jgi:MFS family permease